MIEIKSPDLDHAILSHPRLFVAGGITGAPNWQKGFIARLADLDLVVFNPRRDEFDARDPQSHYLEGEQIMWEHQALHRADIICFWFPKEARCQITLYELGVFSGWHKYGEGCPHLIVGVEDGYVRESDVRIQTRLIEPLPEKIPIVSSLDDIEQGVRSWMKSVPSLGDLLDLDV